MKRFARLFPLAALLAALAGPAAAQQAAAPAFDVLANPDFRLATSDFSASDTLELAAHIHMTLRQHEQAIPMYEALLKGEPNRADLWAMLSAAYNRVDEPREAFDAAEIAITLAPHYPHFYAERGIAAFLLGRHERAVADLAHFAKTFPVNARARFYLGLAQAASGDSGAAQASLVRARALNPALTLLANYYLGLIAAGEGRVAASRQLLGDAHEAFAETSLPVKDLMRNQLRALDGAIAQRLRAATQEADARVAHVPGSPARR